MRRMIVLLTVALASVGAGFAWAAPGRVVVPIHQRVVKSGVIRYSIPVVIGRTRLEAMLDTGSTGLRVLPGAIQAADFVTTGRSTVYHYSSGVALTGVIARATIAVGDVRSPAPIPIQAVMKVSCGQKRPHCPASKVSQRDYRIGGDTARGFEAIIGISLERAAVINPLPGVEASRWIVVLPAPGDPRPGELILNPDPSDLAGFTTFQLVRGRTPYQAIPSCFVKLRGRGRVCGRAVLDSGAPGVSLKVRGGRRRLRVRPGDTVRISFGRAGDGALPPARFTVEASGPTHVRFARPGKGGGALIMAGTLPYFSYEVLYDSTRGAIGLKSRAR